MHAEVSEGLILNFTMDRLQVNGCRNSGINVSEGTVTHCTAANNGGDGIGTPYGTVTNCTARGNNTSGGATVDLFAVSSAVAFCRYGTGDTTGSTLTGNNTP